jgi:para-aminobenzoate synthetase component I
MQPLYFELHPCPDVMAAFERFHCLPGCLLLESAMRLPGDSNHARGKFSFLMAEPFDWIEMRRGTKDPFSILRERLQHFQLEPVAGLPPFQGGMAGLLGYDLNQSLESNIHAIQDDFELPVIALGAYDTVIAWNHHTGQSWILSSGFPELEPEKRLARAESQIRHWRQLLNDETPLSVATEDPVFSAESNSASAYETGSEFPVSGPKGLLSNFSAEAYLAAVQKCIDYIRAGDIFQVNLAQQLKIPACQHASRLYRELRQCNPAPFSAYFDPSRVRQRLESRGKPFQIVSASPERFVAVRDRIVETRPIKGTRRRTGIPLVDIQAREQLAASSKDRAENIMIVDLMRNDLSRCCVDGSIKVTQLCEIEGFQSVFHLVSAVQGQLHWDADLIDLIESVFPGGSITGAPKPRAMQIIAELEPHARGAYCGSIGYFGFDGSADFNILIRTITALRGWWQIPVGGGIVSRSQPKVEYEETWTKAAGMLRAVEACQQNAKIMAF